MQEFLKIAMREKFRFSYWDCAMYLANWVEWNRGIDPASHLRGTYHSMPGYQQLIAEQANGSLTRLVGAIATRAGMHPKALWSAKGDIGVLHLPGLGETGAIRLDNGWSLKVDDGLTRLPLHARALGVWGY